MVFLVEPDLLVRHLNRGNRNFSYRGANTTHIPQDIHPLDM